MVEPRNLFWHHEEQVHELQLHIRDLKAEESDITSQLEVQMTEVNRAIAAYQDELSNQAERLRSGADIAADKFEKLRQKEIEGKATQELVSFAFPSLSPSFDFAFSLCVLRHS